MPNERDVVVLSTTAMKTAFEELGPAFERERGYRLKLTFGPSLQLEKRLAEGENADLAIVTHAGAQDLIARGRGRTFPPPKHSRRRCCALNRSR